MDELDVVRRDDRLIEALARGEVVEDPAVAPLRALARVREAETAVARADVDAAAVVAAGRNRRYAVRSLAVAVTAVATLTTSGVAAVVTGDPFQPAKAVWHRIQDHASGGSATAHGEQADSAPRLEAPSGADSDLPRPHVLGVLGDPARDGNAAGELRRVPMTRTGGWALDGSPSPASAPGAGGGDLDEDAERAHRRPEDMPERTAQARDADSAQTRGRNDSAAASSEREARNDSAAASSEREARSAGAHRGSTDEEDQRSGAEPGPEQETEPTPEPETEPTPGPTPGPTPEPDGDADGERLPDAPAGEDPDEPSVAVVPTEAATGAPAAPAAPPTETPPSGG